ncbi:MAG: alpha/beta fold hydrolase [Pyrinomonadaceae bacterium]
MKTELNKKPIYTIPRVKFIVILFALFCFSTSAQSSKNANLNTPARKEVDVFGAKIRYMEAGNSDAPNLILLHGLGASSESWLMNIAKLAENYHVIAPDMVGFGKSDKPFLKYRIGTFADFMDKFMSELKLEKASFVGNSLGGWVAAKIAVDYPERIEKLVLVDSAGLEPNKVDISKIYRLNNSTRAEIRENMKLMFASPILQNNAALVDQFMTQRVKAGDGFTIESVTNSILRGEDFLDETVATVKVPTLIIWGKQDGILPFEDAARFNALIKGSELELFEGCGHVPQFECAPKFNVTLEKFLSKN